MTLTKLEAHIALGEGRSRQFKRAPENWPAIDFTDDRDGCLVCVPSSV